MRILLLDGNENQAVACVRSLGRAGHRVEVGAAQSWSKAGWSRFAGERFTYPAPEEDAVAFVDFLAKRAAREAGTLVLPLTERATLPISARRDSLLQAGARLILPSHEILLRAFDKRETTDLARSLGMQVPQTLHLDTREQALAAAPNFPFPAVLKPRASQEFDPQTGTLRATGAPIYARDESEFVGAFDELKQRCHAIVAQEWIDGQGSGYFALMNQGKLRAEFAHRRLRDVRPTGSGSALRESVAIEVEMRDGALALLEELHWHGVAMVEFRVRKDGTPVFLEVNGRFWNSLALAVNAGVDFPAMLAEIAEFGDVKTPFPSYSEGIKCRWLLGDTRHLIEVFRGAPPSFPGQFPARGAALRAFLTPQPGIWSDNFQLADPLPELGDWLDFALHRLMPQRQKNAPTSTPGKASDRKTRLGAMHLHSTYSDGEFSLPELRELFIAQGCDFACVTDHAESLDADQLAAYSSECEALSDANFRLVPGLEYACGRLHILGYGVTMPIDSTEPNEVIAAIKAAGGVCVIAHPQERFFARIEGLETLPHGIEIWNSKYDGRYAPRPSVWSLLNRLKRREASLLGFFGQDLHWKKQFRGLFCRIQCEELSREAILAALLRGDFTGVHGELGLPSSGVLAPEVRIQLKRALIASRMLRRVTARAAQVGKMVPAPLKAQLRRVF